MTRLDEFRPEGRQQFIAMIVRTLIVWLFVSLRFVCKYTREKRFRFGWDDFWIVCALAASSVTEGLILWGLFSSLGGLSTLELVGTGKIKNAEDFLLAQYIATVFYYLCMISVMWSVLAFYSSLFAIDKGFRRNSRILSTLTGLWGLACIVSTSLMCIPPSNFWKMKDIDKCGNYNNFVLISGLFEAIISIGILALPVHPVMSLTMSLRRRLSILGIFLLGGFVILSGILRFALAYRPSHYANYDALLLWSSIHIAAAVVGASLPLYSPIWASLTGASKSLVGYSRNLFSTRRSSQKKASVDSSNGQRYGSLTSLAENSSNLAAGSSRSDVMLEEYESWKRADKAQVTSKSAI